MSDVTLEDVIRQIAEAAERSRAAQNERHARLIEALAAPKVLVRDNSGRPVGIRTEVER